MSKIILENMMFHAFHGVLEHEQLLGNTFFVTLSMELDTTLAGSTDVLNNTVDYQLVYDVVKKQMDIPSKLIEHVAQRILDHVFAEFPQIRKLEVKLSKQNPPLGGRVDSVFIELIKER
jgi:7,8-dihydroneopterin aldolase/epimerase/oxygenase